MEDREISSQKITRGARTYFFDIKKTKEGNLYVKMSESTKSTSGFRQNRMFIFEEDLTRFAEVINQTFAKCKALKSQKAPPVKTLKPLPKTA